MSTRAASFSLALSISVLSLGSESGLEFKPSLPRLDFQTAGAVSVLKAVVHKLLSQSPVQVGPGNASLSISGGVGRNPAKQPHTGENSVFLGVRGA